MRNTIAGLIILVAASRGAAQSTGQPIAFDRPESWALKYFTAASTFTPLGAPATRAPGAFELGLEAGWIPSLSESQRRVGFEGTKVEDLNKTPILARVRVAVGLPAGITAELGWVPPVTLNGASANLVSAALERPFFEAAGASLGLRLYGQLGHAKGDITCPESAVSQPAGSAGNPQGCSERSHDTSTLNDAGVALTGGVRLGGARLHLAGGATYNDVQFQVGAITDGFQDSTLLKTHGWTGWVAAGATLPIGSRVEIGAEAFYSPLLVRRPPRQDAQNDGLFNLRGVLRYRFR